MNANSTDFPADGANELAEAEKEAKRAVDSAVKGAGAAASQFADDAASAARTAADRVDSLSNDAGERPANDLVASVTELARQRPFAFFGCGVLTGLVISRLLRPSYR